MVSLAYLIARRYVVVDDADLNVSENCAGSQFSRTPDRAFLHGFSAFSKRAVVGRKRLAKQTRSFGFPRCFVLIDVVLVSKSFSA